MKILVADDDIRVRKVIALAVRDISDEIFECGDGREAEETYAAHLPDWVMMDLQMPVVDGIAATRRIKSSYPDARIIIVTTYESNLLRETARSAGACAYVLKENLSELRQIILKQRVR